MNNQPYDPMPSTDADRWEVLARYASGESPPEEAEAVRRWLAEAPGRGELLAALDATTRRLEYAAPADLDVESALRRVRGRQHEPALRVLSSGAKTQAQPAGTRWRTVALRIAAALVVLVGGGLLWRASRGEVDRPVAVAASTYTTRVGQTDSVRLPDGSRVLLGPASRLVVAAAYGQPARDVELTGEALFDVRHDEAHPFRVRADGATIQDLGTTFSVHSDGGEDVRVVVTAGAVLLKPAGAPSAPGVVLRAGDVGVLPHGGRPRAAPAAATDADLAWTQGRLVFEDAPLSRVRADLRRWYGVDLRVADPALAGRHITASFQGESVDRVLNVIALALGARVERQGDTAVLRAPPRGAAR